MHPNSLSSPPPGKQRVIVSALIVGWLLWQVVVPSWYYLGSNPSDERFSWRMFSDIWGLHKTCKIAVSETVEAAPGGAGASSRRVGVERVLIETWIAELTRGRRAVVEKFLHHRCQGDPAVTDVTLYRVCSDWARLPPHQFRLSCRTGTLEESRIRGGARGTEQVR